MPRQRSLTTAATFLRAGEVGKAWVRSPRCRGPGARPVLRRHCYRTEGAQHQPLRSSQLSKASLSAGARLECNVRVLRAGSALGRPKELATRPPGIRKPGEGGVAVRRQCGSVNAQSHRVLPGKGHESGTWHCFCFCLGIFRFGFVFLGPSL